MSRMGMLILSLSCMLSQQQLTGSQEYASPCCSRSEQRCLKVVCLGCIALYTYSIVEQLKKDTLVQHHDLEVIHQDLQGILQQMKSSHVSPLEFASAPERVLMSDPEPIMPIDKLQRTIKQLKLDKKNN